jgi:hypothetical protein
MRSVYCSDLIAGLFQSDGQKAVQEAQGKEGQTLPDNVYFLKQLVTNACGTIALVHSVANNVDR